MSRCVSMRMFRFFSGFRFSGLGFGVLGFWGCVYFKTLRISASVVCSGLILAIGALEARRLVERLPAAECCFEVSLKP